MTASDDLSHRLTRLERLRKLGVRRGLTADRRRSRTVAPAVAAAPSLPGEAVDTPFGPAWVHTVRHPLAERPDLAEWLAVQPAALAGLDRNPGLLALEPAGAAFIDTETTGLSLGAGTYTFLIGVGEYELPGRAPRSPGQEPAEAEGAFVVRQFFMRSPAEERAQLHLVEEALSRASGVVSFNGRGFDLPLLANRFILASMPLPLAGAPHLDLLPPARRLWHARWGSCSLGSLERNVLGLERSAEDVPGYLIPDIYRQYYRTGGGAEMLGRVFYHNLQDIASMALLGPRMARLFDPHAIRESLDALHPVECLSLGRCYHALAWSEAGVLAYRGALRRLSGAEQVQAWRELGFLYKRLARREEAAALWEEWIGTTPGDDLTPYVELAKHHEWWTRDLAAARGWAAWAIAIAERWSPGNRRDEALAGLLHRLSRIEAKLAGRDAGDEREE